VYLPGHTLLQVCPDDLNQQLRGCAVVTLLLYNLWHVLLLLQLLLTAKDSCLGYSLSDLEVRGYRGYVHDKNILLQRFGLLRVLGASA
jgi:hypothetical protein